MARKPKNASAEIRDAVVRACAVLLFESGLNRDSPADEYVLRNILKELIWTYTGNHDDPGIYLGCPWWTEEALELYERKVPKWAKQVALEHVVERQFIAAGLLEARDKEQIRRILDSGETCVVLRTQHKLLVSGDGWKRYEGLKVVPGPKAQKRLGGAVVLAPKSD